MFIPAWLIGLGLVFAFPWVLEWLFGIGLLGLFLTVKVAERLLPTPEQMSDRERARRELAKQLRRERRSYLGAVSMLLLMGALVTDLAADPNAMVVGVALFAAGVALAINLMFSPAPSTMQRPSPVENWMPHDQEEAGPRTSAWVEEKLRQAKKT
jgi:hypothetical protein